MPRHTRSRHLGGSLLLGSLLLVILSACDDPEVLPKAPRGVILISLDNVAVDRMSLYGYERETSPRLDAFFEKGSVFERCISASNWTLPGHMSMLTGVRPRTHGIVDHSMTNGPKVPLISEELQSHGVATGAFTNHSPNVSEIYGFDRGFDTFKCFQVKTSFNS